MASIKVKFRPSTVADNEGTVYYQIIHERKVRQLLSDYKVYQFEWDEKREMVVTDHKSDRKSLILSIRERIRWDVERLTRIDRKLDANGMSYSADDIIEEFKRYAHEYSLFNFMESIIAKLKQNGKIRTSETYRSAFNSFRKFLISRESDDNNRKNDDIMLDCLSSAVMEDYEAWLKNRGVAPNTISFYTRILRAVYNRAVEDDIIENRNPFRHVYTGVDKTVKRALPLSAISRLRKLNLSQSPALAYARDMFMLSFYMRGMSFIDMAFLRKSDLRNGHVTYRRHKTGQQLSIAWISEMETIISHYPTPATPYLLPIITCNCTDERIFYQRVSTRVNRGLKQIANILGISAPLTLYVARHSWASAARAKGIPLNVISEGMGHDSETTTQIYLSSLDNSVVDRANSRIIAAL